MLLKHFSFSVDKFIRENPSVTLTNKLRSMRGKYMNNLESVHIF